MAILYCNFCKKMDPLSEAERDEIKEALINLGINEDDIGLYLIQQIG